MKRSVQTLRTSTRPSDPDEWAEHRRLSVLLEQAQRGEWTNDLLWRWATDQGLRELFELYEITIPEEGVCSTAISTS